MICCLCKSNILALLLFLHSALAHLTRAADWLSLAVTSRSLESQALCHIGLVLLVVRIEERRLASRREKIIFGSADLALL
jgi:energy-converting hydrogenase Eha subunit C